MPGTKVSCGCTCIHGSADDDRGGGDRAVQHGTAMAYNSDPSVALSGLRYTILYNVVSTLGSFIAHED